MKGLAIPLKLTRILLKLANCSSEQKQQQQQRLSMESGTSSAPSLPQPRVVSTTIPDKDTSKDVDSAAAATKQARTDSQVNDNLNNCISILRLLCYGIRGK